MTEIFRKVKQRYYRIPSVPRCLGAMTLLQAVAYMASGILISHTGAENNSALVYTLVVSLTALLTDGYLYGILSSLAGGFCINYFFMYPYAAFSLSYAGYPVAMLSMVSISCVVSALTSRVKKQAIEAARREQNTKLLCEMNTRLNEEKSAIQLEAAREAIHSNLLRAVSHDLRTPLTAISGSASVLMNSEELSPANRAMVQDIKTDADALITMVENLLSVTRIQGGDIPLKKQEELLEEVAGDALVTIKRRFPGSCVELVQSDDILYLPIEPMLIKQVMVNLMENAIRHSGDTTHIQLRLYRQGSWAVTEVRDHGRGLSPEVLRAVQNGHQLPRDLSGDSTRGMGIGLSVCQSIIKAHSGFFAAENDPAGGAVFRFGLPMEESEHE